MRVLAKRKNKTLKCVTYLIFHFINCRRSKEADLAMTHENINFKKTSDQIQRKLLRRIPYQSRQQVHSQLWSHRLQLPAR